MQLLRVSFNAKQQYRARRPDCGRCATQSEKRIETRFRCALSKMRHSSWARPRMQKINANAGVEEHKNSGPLPKDSRREWGGEVVALPFPFPIIFFRDSPFAPSGVCTLRGVALGLEATIEYKSLPRQDPCSRGCHACGRRAHIDARRPD